MMESMAQITASANGWPSRASGILKHVLWAVTGRQEAASVLALIQTAILIGSLSTGSSARDRGTWGQVKL